MLDLDLTSWFLRILGLCVCYLLSQLPVLIRVSDLRMASDEWIWEMIKIVLWEIDHDELRRFPIHALKGNDKLICHYNSNRVFSVLSGYFLALNDWIEGSDIQQGDNSYIFKKL